MQTLEESQLQRAKRDARIAELEARMRGPRRVGVPPWLAALILVGVGGLLWSERLDVAYLFQSRTPMVIGHEGNYDFSGLRSNRYVQLHGVPSARGAFYLSHGEVRVLVGLKDSPFILERGGIDREQTWKPGGLPPPPDSRPFTVGGRLLRKEDAPKFQEAMTLVESWGEVRAREGAVWLIEEGVRPGKDKGQLLLFGFMAMVLLLNAYFLARGLASRLL